MSEGLHLATADAIAVATLRAEDRLTATSGARVGCQQLVTIECYISIKPDTSQHVALRGEEVMATFVLVHGSWVGSVCGDN